MRVSGCRHTQTPRPVSAVADNTGAQGAADQKTITDHWSQGQTSVKILLKNLQLLFWTFFDWGRGQADQTQLRARQQLPAHRFCRL